MNPTVKKSFFKKHWIAIVILVIGFVISFAFLAKADPGVTVDPVTVIVTEGEIESYPINVQLHSVPANPVTVTPVTSGDPIELDESELVISDTTPVTFYVLVTNDELNLGDLSSELYFELSSEDPDYNFNSQTISVTILEDDLPGVNYDTGRGRLNLLEGNAATNVPITLNLEPTADVVVSVSSVEGNLDLFPTEFTFTSENWDTPQNLAVTVPDDSEDTGSRTGTISFTVVSEDGNYDGLSVTSISGIVISDNDTPTNTFVFSSSSIEVVENGDPVQVTIALASDPGVPTTYDVHLGSETFTQISPTQLTFTGENWNAPQTVTVTANGGAGTTNQIILSTEVCTSGGKFEPPTCEDQYYTEEQIEISIVSSESDSDSEEDDEEEPAPVTDSRKSTIVGGYGTGSITSKDSRTVQQETKTDTSTIVKNDSRNSSISRSVSFASASKTVVESTKILVKGIVDNDVAALQTFLNTVLAANLSIDGKLGDRTKAAIETFQKGTGINPDGIVGPETKNSINAVGQDTSDTNVRSLRSGNTGERVRILQRLLTLKGIQLSVDGIFGSQTESAILKFQQERGITVDGIAGPQTFLELQK